MKRARRVEGRPDRPTACDRRITRKNFILVGRFGAPHGVRGELRLRSFTEVPSMIGTYGPLFDAGGDRCFAITSLRPLKEDIFVAKVLGVETRSEAALLTNLDLFVARESLPEPDPEEFYLADLIDLTAATESGEVLGRVVSVPDYGGGPLLEIAPAEGGESYFVPFRKDVVPLVDIAGGRLVIIPLTETSGEPSEIDDEPGATKSTP